MSRLCRLKCEFGWDVHHSLTLTYEALRSTCVSPTVPLQPSTLRRGALAKGPESYRFWSPEIRYSARSTQWSGVLFPPWFSPLTRFRTAATFMVVRTLTIGAYD